MQKKGFTLIELLIVVAIIAILVITFTVSVMRQRNKASNTRVKKDLAELQIAFENYYNDKNCYPPASYFDSSADCGSNALSPYLPSIPCDRQTGNPYVLETDATGCAWYRLYGTLDSPASDPEALKLYAESGSNLGNYGVSSSNTSVSVYFPLTPDSSSNPINSPTPTPTSNPSPEPNIYYCQGLNNCSLVPVGLTCTPSYADPNCGAAHCSNTVSVCQ